MGELFKDKVVDLPHDMDAERSVLGILLVQNHLYDQVADLINKDDFYEPLHGKIYGVIKKLQEQGEIVSYITVRPFFSGEKAKKEISKYLKDLSLNPWPTVTLIVHVRRVAEHAKRRHLLEMMFTAKEKLNTENHNTETETSQSTMAYIEECLHKMTRGTLSKEMVVMKDGISDYTKNVLASCETGMTYGLKTGYGDLDKILGGIGNTDLVIIGARTSMGKTAFALNLSLNISKGLKNKVAFFSFEMSLEQMNARILSILSKIPIKKIQHANLNPQEKERLQAASLDARNYSMLFQADMHSTIEMLQHRIRRLKRVRDIDVVVIDYTQLVYSEDAKLNINRVNLMTYVTSTLKQIAMNLKVPIIALSQLSRASESQHRAPYGHRPQLSDLRDSGSLEQDADIVLLLHRAEYYVKNKKPDSQDSHAYPKWQDQMEDCKNLCEVIVAKNRNGGTGPCVLFFEEATTTFKNLAAENTTKKKDWANSYTH